MRITFGEGKLRLKILTLLKIRLGIIRWFSTCYDQEGDDGKYHRADKRIRSARSSFFRKFKCTNESAHQFLPDCLDRGKRQFHGYMIALLRIDENKL